MTREEAIKYLSEELEKTKEVVALTERDFGVSESVWHTETAAFELAIDALREQEKVVQIEQVLTGKMRELERQLTRNSHDVVTGAQGGWISVEERLPKKKGQYLVYTKWTYGNFIRLCNWTPKYNGCEEHLNGRAIWYNYDSEYGDYECKDVTHWMPLPEGPKEEV